MKAAEHFALGYGNSEINIPPQSRGVTTATAAGKKARQGSTRTPCHPALAVAGVRQNKRTTLGERPIAEKSVQHPTRRAAPVEG